MYVPLTQQDYAIHQVWRYRVGHWLRNNNDRFTVLAAFGAVAVPVAVLFSLLTNGSEKPGVWITLLVIWLIETPLVYARWFEHRQEASERRRGYRFYVPETEYDIELAQAKGTLLSMASTVQERDQALDLLLSRGACSLPGQPAPPRARGG
jgi:hypothetical protein